MPEIALITGFEPYGGLTINPSAKLVDRLDGERLGGLRIVARKLPVALEGHAERLERLLAELEPSVVIALGLYPGEPAIRLERFGLNLADFEMPDNAGLSVQDQPLRRDGANALAATLPLREIERALLADGIPARLSNTAGAFLCNATLYTLLAALERLDRPTLCGFIHLPHLPEQVADLLARGTAGTEIASMELSMMERAVRTALALTAAALERTRALS